MPHQPHNPKFTFRGTAAVAALLLAAPLSRAQDSTATAPAATDALSAYDTSLQRIRYIVDAAPITSSWGNTFLIAPILKAPAETDPLFTTQMAGATSVSADLATNLTFPPRTFARWTAPGAGLNPTKNTPPTPADAISVSAFSRRFALAHTGVSAGATNIISAVLGVDAANPSRFFVERTVALSSRPTAAAPDTATLTLGGIDSSGTLFLRADAATAKAPQPIRNDNLIRITSASRTASTVAALGWNTETGPESADPAAITYVGAGLGVAVTIPALLPASPAPLALSLDFAARYLANATPREGSLAAGLSALRGSPTCSLYKPASVTNAVGTVACLARSTNNSPTDALNLFAIDATATPIPGSARAAVIPSPLNTPGNPGFNTAARAEFRHYRNQSLFRGPHGHAAIGYDPQTSAPTLAAVATDPDAGSGGGAGEALLIARFESAQTTWTIAAHPGTPVLNGPNGTTIATITSGSPVTFSAPALDLLGNVYIVANITPTTGGSPTGTQALLKGVRTPASPTGYTFERILESGQTFTGPNSTRPITITRLRLADSDSIDSGGFHAGAILQHQAPGATTNDPASPAAFGGVAVNAVITYDAATPAQSQRYEATLFIAPGATPPSGGCVGDFNNDGSTNTADLVTFLARFGQTVPPGSPGDLNNDGSVNTQDLTRFLSAFGCTSR